LPAYIQLVQYRRMPAMVLSSDRRILVLAALVANLARDFFASRKWNDKLWRFYGRAWLRLTVRA